MSSKLPAYCVYASELTDATGRTSAPGDGITSPARRLYALAATAEEAGRIKTRLETGKLLTRRRMPGDGTEYPVLDVGPYNPLDFVGRQNRDQYTGKRFAALCGDLADQAKANAEGIA